MFDDHSRDAPDAKRARPWGLYAATGAFLLFSALPVAGYVLVMRNAPTGALADAFLYPLYFVTAGNKRAWLAPVCISLASLWWVVALASHYDHGARR